MFQGFKKIIFKQIILGIICLNFLSCKKEIINPTKSMNQIFYTQEGSPYIIKTATFNVDNEALVAPLSVSPTVLLNDSSTNSSLGNLSITTKKNIIPISLSMAVRDVFAVAPGIIVDITSPYYFGVRGVTPILENAPDAQLPLSKMIPLIDRIFFTDSANFGFNVRYGQAVFSDGDFIDVKSRMFISFTSEQATALTFTQDGFTIPIGTYDGNMTFIYFELL